MSNSSKAGEGMLVGRVRQARNWWGERARGVTRGGGDEPRAAGERERGVLKAKQGAVVKEDRK